MHSDALAPFVPTPDSTAAISGQQSQGIMDDPENMSRLFPIRSTVGIFLG